MVYAYPCDFAPDANGRFVATLPDVPEAVTGGSDRAEALRMTAEALAVALSRYLHSGRDVPPPGTPVGH